MRSWDGSIIVDEITSPEEDGPKMDEGMGFRDHGATRGEIVRKVDANGLPLLYLESTLRGGGICRPPVKQRTPLNEGRLDEGPGSTVDRSEGRARPSGRPATYVATYLGGYLAGILACRQAGGRPIVRQRGSVSLGY